MGIIKAGDIIHIFVKNTKPPKEKFIIVLGIDGSNVSVLTVFINSKINTNVYRTQYQQDLCYKIKQSDYPFLTYDSYIDLNAPFERSKNDLEWLVNNRPDAKKGSLKSEHLEDCIRLIHTSRAIKGKTCKKFGFFN
ncbi:MAG: hypothetical protein KGV59_06325 [Tenacibaculum sp.]|nr:hypothetical protein [Tenacibaculum sp.]